MNNETQSARAGDGIPAGFALANQPAGEPGTSIDDGARIFARVMEYQGKTRRVVRNPNLTARECIALANYIAASDRASYAAAPAAPAAVPMCSEQAVLHALTMARSEAHQQGDAALWQAFGRAMWRQFNAMAAAPAGWVSFADREPPRDARLDNPAVIAGRKVLVTNNFKARDAMGRMSHVWFVSPIKTNDGWVAFDEADRKIFDLTYWFDPLDGIQAPATVDRLCRTDGRCQYAIDHGAEGMGHCPQGKCAMPAGEAKQ